MTSSAQPGRGRLAALGIALPLLLATVMLVPVAVLTVGGARAAGDDRAQLARERDGVEYLRSLGAVAVALADAESAAVSGRSPDAGALNQAVAATSAVDARLGDDLRTHERWAGLRAKIEALPQRDLGDPTASYAAYTEATDLLLALHEKVRQTSGLVRDSEQDSHSLQSAAGGHLPVALIAAGRLTDLAAMAPVRGNDPMRTAAELAMARTATLQPATRLVEDLRAAVDRTSSAELGGKLLTQLDAYQRAIEALAAASVLQPPPADLPRPDDPPARDRDEDRPTDEAPPLRVDAARIAAQRAAAQAAGIELSRSIFDQLDLLLANRVDRLDRERDMALGWGLLATATGVLLTVLVLRGRTSGRRRASAQAGPTSIEDVDSGSWSVPTTRPPLGSGTFGLTGQADSRGWSAASWTGVGAEPAPASEQAPKGERATAIRGGEALPVRGRADAAR